MLPDSGVTTCIKVLGFHAKSPVGSSKPTTEISWELELIQSHMTQKPMLRGEVGARALRNQEGRGKGRKVVHTSELVAAWWGARACMCCRAPGAP